MRRNRCSIARTTVGRLNAAGDFPRQQRLAAVDALRAALSPTQLETPAAPPGRGRPSARGHRGRPTTRRARKMGTHPECPCVFSTSACSQLLPRGVGLANLFRPLVIVHRRGRPRADIPALSHHVVLELTTSCCVLWRQGRRSLSRCPCQTPPRLVSPSSADSTGSIGACVAAGARYPLTVRAGPFVHGR